MAPIKETDAVVIAEPVVSTTARSIVFSSSRTLPGQRTAAAPARPRHRCARCACRHADNAFRRSDRRAPGCLRDVRGAKDRNRSRSADKASSWNRASLTICLRSRLSPRSPGHRRGASVPPPAARTRSCSTRSSFDWIAGLSVPISSRKIELAVGERTFHACSSWHR